MATYYKIFPTSTVGINIFDTVRMVAKECGYDQSKLIKRVGFGLGGDINEKLMNPPNNYFSIENLVMRRLNDFCRENGLNIRVSRPVVRGLMREMQYGFSRNSNGKRSKRYC